MPIGQPLRFDVVLTRPDLHSRQPSVTLCFCRFVQLVGKGRRSRRWSLVVHLRFLRH